MDPMKKTQTILLLSKKMFPFRRLATLLPITAITAITTTMIQKEIRFLKSFDYLYQDNVLF
jgi:hypothetical protein